MMWNSSHATDHVTRLHRLGEDPLHDIALADEAETELDELVTETTVGDAGAELPCDFVDLDRPDPRGDAAVCGDG
eukprot:3325981-Pyramimonas_sp.AAC.1